MKQYKHKTNLRSLLSYLSTDLDATAIQVERDQRIKNRKEASDSFRESSKIASKIVEELDKNS
jgi:hypothetical protein